MCSCRVHLSAIHAPAVLLLYGVHMFSLHFIAFAYKVSVYNCFRNLCADDSAASPSADPVASSSIRRAPRSPPRTGMRFVLLAHRRTAAEQQQQ